MSSITCQPLNKLKIIKVYRVNKYQRINYLPRHNVSLCIPLPLNTLPSFPPSPSFTTNIFFPLFSGKVLLPFSPFFFSSLNFGCFLIYKLFSLRAQPFARVHFYHTWKIVELEFIKQTTYLIICQKLVRLTNFVVISWYPLKRC